MLIRIRENGGGEYDGVQINNPEEIIKHYEFDNVIIASQPGYEVIKQRLETFGIDEDRIISSYVEQPLTTRIQFLKDIAKIMHEDGVVGACCEAGVFEGDFKEVVAQDNTGFCFAL